MEDNFKMKVYGYNELAQLYFPNISKKSASIQLGRWIKLNSNLQKELKKLGFMPRQRLMTPKQVQCMVEYLGFPEE